MPRPSAASSSDPRPAIGGVSRSTRWGDAICARGRRPSAPQRLAEQVVERPALGVANRLRRRLVICAREKRGRRRSRRSSGLGPQEEAEEAARTAATARSIDRRAPRRPTPCRPPGTPPGAQRLGIDLAVGGERQLVDDLEVRRVHVHGEQRGQVALERRNVDARPVAGRRDEGREAPGERVVTVDDRDRRPHAGMVLRGPPRPRRARSGDPGS